MTRRARSQRGFTLIELIIVITLVAAISVGLMMAMRISINTLEKVQTRLSENRRVMGVEQLVQRQIADVIPATGDCGPNPNPGNRVPLFNGDASSLRFVTTQSLEDGARGYPHLVEYLVEPEPSGTFRLILNEHLYTGPSSSGPFCQNRQFLPVAVGPQSVVLASGLAYCRFAYHEYIAESMDQGRWVDVWRRPNLPQTVRVEMAAADPAPGRLPLVSLHVPIHVTREVMAPYADQ